MHVSNYLYWKTYLNIYLADLNQNAKTLWFDHTQGEHADLNYTTCAKALTQKNISANISHQNERV